MRLRPITLALVLLFVGLGVCAAADPVLATIACGGGASKNTPVNVATSATESAIVFTTSQGDNPQIQYVDTVAWTWLATSNSSATVAVAAGQTFTVQEDGGALTTTRYVKSTSAGILTVNRVR